MEDRFSVYQFLSDGTCITVQEHVPIEEALRSADAIIYVNDTQDSITQRVTITDCWDITTYEWVYGKGIVYPPKDGWMNGWQE